MTTLFQVNGPDFLKVRISISMLKCTYNCEYCVAASGQSQTKGIDCSQGMERPVWGENGLELSQKAIKWVTSLPYQVGVRYDVHGEPLLNDDVVHAVSWLTHQENVAFVEVQTNASMFRKKIHELADLSDLNRLSLFCTFHHSQVSPEKFMENIILARNIGVQVIVNVLVFSDNLLPVGKVLELCRKQNIRTSADIRYPGFTVPPTGDGKRARHFLSNDPFQILLDSISDGYDAFKIIADSGPLGKDIRFLAAMLVGLYGLPGRQCSAGHDYVFVDRWGDVYRCFNYADMNKNKLGSVLDTGFIPKLRKEAYAKCHYRETCHQKEEYGNLKILREHRYLRQASLNCFCGAELNVDSQQLYAARMAMIEFARHSLKHDRKGLFFTDLSKP
jgi:sulfatase maturation enzyme AslB (radical SAM superfamily)